MCSRTVLSLRFIVSVVGSSVTADRDYRPGARDLEAEPGHQLDPPVARGHASGAEAEAARAGEGLAEERRGEVPHRRREVHVVEDVLGRDGDREGAAARSALVPAPLRPSASSSASEPAAPAEAAPASAAAASAPASAVVTALGRAALTPAAQRD